MRLELVNSSVVVLAKQHNPSILHPAFLTARKIVPPDWELAAPPVCTPPVSVMKYTNGLTFTVELSKFQLLEESPTEDFNTSLLPSVAYGYVKSLPHVAYTAVGVNFMGLIECADAQSQLLRRFLCEGPWNAGRLKTQGLGLKLLYAAAGAQLALSLDAGAVQREGDSAPRQGILVNGNYHRGLDGADRVASARRAIRRYVSRGTHFARTCRAILGLED